MKRIFILICFSFLQYKSFAQILISNVNVVDVEKKKINPKQTVLITDGKISFVGKDVKFKLPASTQIIDGTDKYVMPGLTDAHVHFFQSGGLFARPDAIDLRTYQPYDKEIKWTQDNMPDLLSRYLSVGITSVIDVGSTNNFLKQRQQYSTDANKPSIFMTGALLTTYVPEPYKNLGDNSPFTKLENEEQARKLVQVQLPNKPDFIKIWYIVTDADVEKGAAKNLPLVKAVIDEAHKNNLRVAVHSTEQITAKFAVEAGADFLVHDIDNEIISTEFISLLKQKNVVLCPTLVVAGNYGKVLGKKYVFSTNELNLANPTQVGSILNYPYPDTTKAKQYIKYYGADASAKKQAHEDSVMYVNLKKLMDGGVTIATGTDAGNIGTQHASSYFTELVAMQIAGLTNWQIFEASTINGAKALNKQAEWGSVTTNKQANLILLNANPLDNLSNLQKIEFVINKGKLFKPDTLITKTPEMLAQQQLNAYNAHNLEAFLQPYDDDVEIYTFPNKLEAKGKDEMRKQYLFIEKKPKLFCKLLNRIVQGNVVIDHEEVYFGAPKPSYGIAQYYIENGKIKKVYFIQ